MFKTAEQYCQGKASFLTEVLHHAYEIKFEEQPNYDKIRFLLKKILLDQDVVPVVPFVWNHQAGFKLQK